MKKKILSLLVAAVAFSASPAFAHEPDETYEGPEEDQPPPDDNEEPYDISPVEDIAQESAPTPAQPKKQTEPVELDDDNLFSSADPADDEESDSDTAKSTHQEQGSVSKSPTPIHIP